MKEIIYQDSYTEKVQNGSLKVYLDMKNPKECEEKLKTFIKIKNFIRALNKMAI
ncbi:MAG: hypothetical protein U9O94_00150 [Nanoarchaeota archaeon]|nr:hypothetical protein [Nanoarchaeota archaeon]